MTIGFIMDNWADIDPHKTSTLTLIHEAMVCDHKVALLYPRNLTIRNNVVNGFFKNMKRPAKLTENMVGFHERAAEKDRLIAEKQVSRKLQAASCKLQAACEKTVLRHPEAPPRGGAH